MQVVRDFFERKTVRRTEREDQRVVERGGLQFEVELPAEALAQCEAPGTHDPRAERRSEEHTSELQSLMRISYAVFCLKKKKKIQQNTSNRDNQNSGKQSLQA